MTSKFESYGAQWLMEQVLEPPIWVVEGLLPTSSTNVLASPPKFGKSLFCLQLAHCVATGQPFLGRNVTKSQVAYLCLEDQKSRMQNRLWALCNESSDDLRLIEAAATLGTGLIAQLQNHLRDYPETKLFIIDTLQITRDEGSDFNYADDYADMRKFKSFADANKVCCLIVHHVRKSQSTTDAFADIAGTTAISGAADGTFVMRKEARSCAECRLFVTGRDISYSEMILRREGVQWELVEQVSEEEIESRRIPECVIDVACWVSGQCPEWQGTATQLIEAVGLTDVSPAVLGKFLAQHRSWLLDRGIDYRVHRSSTERTMSFARLPSNDDE